MKEYHKEDCELLTDRWGSPIKEGGRRQPKRLISAMYDEESFIVRRDGERGILIEIEYDDRRKPTKGDKAIFAKIVHDFPDADLWLTRGDHVFNNRWAVRAFFSEKKAKPARVHALGKLLMDAMYR